MRKLWSGWKVSIPKPFVDDDARTVPERVNAALSRDAYDAFEFGDVVLMPFPFTSHAASKSVAPSWSATAPITARGLT
jgi:hypothetical protein